MRRMPIRHRIAPFPRGRCLPRDYAVLVGISPGYSPVAGRLHTCYSPVRRSPAEESKLSSPLPLDLHVLSLSLAFILSQDQTLRCCLSCLFFFFLQKSKKPRLSVFVYLPSRLRVRSLSRRRCGSLRPFARLPVCVRFGQDDSVIYLVGN